jgi:hypothetical protein
MYVKSGDRCEINAVTAIEGKIFRLGLDLTPEAEVTLGFLNSESMVFYGRCPYKITNPRTLETLQTLLTQVEEDFGKVIFEGGAPAPFGPAAVKAESAAGLPKKLGG